MIYRVAVTGELITQWFTKGYKVHGEVLEGLPEGAKLIDARYSYQGERLHLIFASKEHDKQIDFLPVFKRKEKDAD